MSYQPLKAVYASFSIVGQIRSHRLHHHFLTNKNFYIEFAHDPKEIRHIPPSETRLLPLLVMSCFVVYVGFALAFFFES